MSCLSVFDHFVGLALKGLSDILLPFCFITSLKCSNASVNISMSPKIQKNIDVNMQNNV